jgi:hypothetical protein
MGLGSGIRDPGSGIRDPGSEIRDPEKTYSGSQISDLGVKKAPDSRSRIRIRNTLTTHCKFFFLQILLA